MEFCADCQTVKYSLLSEKTIYFPFSFTQGKMLLGYNYIMPQVSQEKLKVWQGWEFLGSISGILMVRPSAILGQNLKVYRDWIEGAGYECIRTQKMGGNLRLLCWVNCKFVIQVWFAGSDSSACSYVGYIGCMTPYNRTTGGASAGLHQPSYFIRTWFVTRTQSLKNYSCCFLTNDEIDYTLSSARYPHVKR